MKLLFSTKSVHPRDRLAYWLEEATKAFVAHEFRSSLKDNFDGEITVGTIGGVGVADFRTKQAEVTRAPHCLRSAEDDDVLLLRQIEGGVTAHQDGRDVARRPGDLYILDPRRPFRLEVPHFTQALVFKIPRVELQARLGQLSSLTAMPAPRDASVTSLVSDFLSMLASRCASFDRTTGVTLMQQALDLVALAFQGKREMVQLSSAKATTLLRLKSAIEERLHDPELKPAKAAAAAGISVRYANALLANENTSLERYITLRRLHRCNECLRSPVHSSRTVSDIAYSFGFSDLAHFTRRFRAHFGCSPSEARQLDHQDRHQLG